MDSINIILDYPCVTMFLATMLLVRHSIHRCFTFCFCINPCSQNSVKLRFTNIQGFCSNLFACEPSFESSCPDNLALCETNLQDPIGSSNSFVSGYLPLIEKDTFIHMHGLTFYVKERLPFAC